MLHQFKRCGCQPPPSDRWRLTRALLAAGLPGQADAPEVVDLLLDEVPVERERPEVALDAQGAVLDEDPQDRGGGAVLVLVMHDDRPHAGQLHRGDGAANLVEGDVRAVVVQVDAEPVDVLQHLIGRRLHGLAAAAGPIVLVELEVRELPPRAERVAERLQRGLVTTTTTLGHQALVEVAAAGDTVPLGLDDDLARTDVSLVEADRRVSLGENDARHGILPSVVHGLPFVEGSSPFWTGITCDINEQL